MLKVIVLGRTAPAVKGGIAKYNAQIFELRRLGCRIKNKTQEVNGQRRSWFRRETGLAQSSAAATSHLAMLLRAFFSRFAIGFLAANVSLRIHPAISGALVGLLISLPDAFAMKSYAGILGTGLIFGALAGWAAKTWGS